jgi:hypothetical protein
VWVTKDKCLLDEEDKEDDEEDYEDEEDEVMWKIRHHKKPSITIPIFNPMSLL